MVIIFGNQKGGAGKTTLATLFANYVSLVKNRKVLVIDMDAQRTIYARYTEDKNLENPELYEVVELDIDKYPAIAEGLKQDEEQVVIIDLPGRLDDDSLVPILQSAKNFVVPFHYDRNTFHSTITFCSVAKLLNPDAKMLFVPNRVKSTVRYEIQEQVNGELERFGKITSKIPDTVSIQRVTTRDIPSKVLEHIEKSFEEIIAEIL